MTAFLLVFRNAVRWQLDWGYNIVSVVVARYDQSIIRLLALRS